MIEHRFYVYAVTVDGVIRYIGKGTGARASRHLRMAKNISDRRKSGEKVNAPYLYNALSKAYDRGALIGDIRLASGLTSEEAYAREIAEIASFEPSQLWNVTGGGPHMAKSAWKNPRLAADVSSQMKRLWEDPKYRAMQAAAHRDGLSDPVKRASFLATRTDPDVRKKLSQGVKRSWHDPVVRERKIAALRAAKNKPETRAKRSAAVRAQWADPVIREKKRKAQSNGHLARWARIRAAATADSVA